MLPRFSYTIFNSLCNFQNFSTISFVMIYDKDIKIDFEKFWVKKNFTTFFYYFLLRLKKFNGENYEKLLSRNLRTLMDKSLLISRDEKL